MICFCKWHHSWGNSSFAFYLWNSASPIPREAHQKGHVVLLFIGLNSHCLNIYCNSLLTKTIFHIVFPLLRAVWDTLLSKENMNNWHTVSLQSESALRIFLLDTPSIAELSTVFYFSLSFSLPLFLLFFFCYSWCIQSYLDNVTSKQ